VAPGDLRDADRMAQDRLGADVSVRRPGKP